jgi:hypothetical protein
MIWGKRYGGHVSRDDARKANDRAAAQAPGGIAGGLLFAKG